MRGLTPSEREVLEHSLLAPDSSDEASPPDEIAIADELVRRGLAVWVVSPQHTDFEVLEATAVGRELLSILKGIT